MPLICGIPEETWTNKEVNLNHLHIFGWISYVHIELSDNSKLDQCLRGESLLDTKPISTAIGSWISRTAKSRHKDMVFNEQKTYKDLQKDRSTSEDDLSGTSEHFQAAIYCGFRVH